MRLNRLKASARTSIRAVPGRLNDRAMRKSTLVWYGLRNVLRSSDGMRVLPPAPRMPVEIFVVGAGVPLTKFVNGAPADAVMIGANVKWSNHTLSTCGCHTALKLKRCGTSKFEMASSAARSYGFSTLFPDVNVCDDWPLSRDRENV